MSSLYTNSDIKDILGNSSSLPVTIPFRCDVPVILYCDGNRCAELGANNPYQIKCTIGTHTISLVSSEVSSITKEFQVESVTSGTKQSIVVNIAAEVAKAKKKALINQERMAERQQKEKVKEAQRASKIIKRKQREKEKKLFKDIESGKKTWLSDEEQEIYNKRSSKKHFLNEFCFILFILGCGICFVALLIIIYGWIKGTGHGCVWTWIFWSGLIAGITGIIIED